MAWNDERVDLLKKLWSDGLSASQIAGRLGGVTRNAVIGKVHRLGLSGRATTSRMKSHRPRTRAQSTGRLMKPRFANIGNPRCQLIWVTRSPTHRRPRAGDPAQRAQVDPDADRVSCRWPIGDPQLADFTLWTQQDHRLALLRLHARRAFQPPQPRRRDARYTRPA